MKISLTITVDASPEGVRQWATAYGVEPTGAVVREDIRRYIGNQIASHFANNPEYPAISADWR
ncbi:hypothetical protein ACFWYW_23875 [Nonomuraea sp. NPDC059023]|uniref:hypothetical protein n=1 Tax=unclassified Nonomuraea TaxID=2593643 RepID=UPI0036B28E96